MSLWRALFRNLGSANNESPQPVHSRDRFSRDPEVKRLVEAYRTFCWYGKPEDEKKAAKRTMKEVGPDAIPAVIAALDQLHFDVIKNAHSQERHPFIDCTVTAYVGYLIGVLTEIGDERAVDVLLKHFAFDRISSNAPAEDICRFFARIGANTAAAGLVAYLNDEYWHTRVRAAYGLGLLGVENTSEAILSALDTYGEEVRKALTRADTDFSRAIINEWHGRRDRPSQSRQTAPSKSAIKRGGANEPYCSDECYSQGGKAVFAVSLGNQAGQFGTCITCGCDTRTGTAMAIPVSGVIVREHPMQARGIDAKAIPARGSLALFCRNCIDTKKAQEYISAIKFCAWCGESLQDRL